MCRAKTGKEDQEKNHPWPELTGLAIYISQRRDCQNFALVCAVWAAVKGCSIQGQDFNDTHFYEEQPHAALET